MADEHRGQDDNDTFYDNAAGVDEEDTRQFPQTQGAAGLSEELPVDPIKDEWSAFIAAGRAEQAADAAQSAFAAAKEAERMARVAREADLPNATQLAQLAYSATQRSVAANLFAKRAAEAAKQAAEAAKLAAKIQEKPILKEKKSE